MRIQSTVNLAAIMRNQISTLQQQTSTSISAKNKLLHAKPKSEPDLASFLALQLSQISKTDVNRRRKAFRIFLESVIVSKFGQTIVNDIHFPEMINQIQDQMSSDPELGSIIEEATDLMFSKIESSNKKLNRDKD